MISKYSQNSSEFANKIANSMENTLNKTAEDIEFEKNVEDTINNLSRSAEIFDELNNCQASKIITKIIEKLALSNGK